MKHFDIRIGTCYVQFKATVLEPTLLFKDDQQSADAKEDDKQSADAKDVKEEEL